MVINAECHSWLVRDVLPEMMKLNQGHIVSIASIAGVAGIPAGTDYCASKFAALGFNEALRNEMKYLKKNIRVTTICPFFINTGMFEGVQMALVPMLDQNHVVKRIITAIR